jgi:hypothetical protein
LLLLLALALLSSLGTLRARSGLERALLGKHNA